MQKDGIKDKPYPTIFPNVLVPSIILNNKTVIEPKPPNTILINMTAFCAFDSSLKKKLKVVGSLVGPRGAIET